MEGVGARLGRSSTRYGPATVFNGPVRKWKKKWMHVSASSNASVNHTPSSNGTNGNNGNNGSHLLLYKWTPTTQSNNNGDNKGSMKDDTPVVTPEEEPPRKKFRYVPVAVIEEQKREAEEKADEEEAKPIIADPSTGGTSKSDGSDGKPDINDVPVEETQAMDEDQSTPQELNETSLDLNLGLKAHDGDRDSSSKPEDPNKVQLERVSSGGVGTLR